MIESFDLLKNGLGVLPKHHMAGLVEGAGSRGRPGWAPAQWAAPEVPGPGGCLSKQKENWGPALFKRKMKRNTTTKKNNTLLYFE